MSDPTNPIDPARFALALEDLPLDSLHDKAAEIRNSIAHLKSSNDQMLPFAEEGDDDCKEAMFENLVVIGRMNERIEMLKTEVEKRGMMWPGEEGGEKRLNGEAETNGEAPAVNGQTVRRAPSGRLTDEELRRQLEAQMAEGENEEEGVHL